MPMNGIALAGLGGGILFLYSAIQGKSILAEIPALIQGKSPSTIANTNTISIPNADTANGSVANQPLLNMAGLGDTGASSTSASQNQALAKSIAISMGHADWTIGTEWEDWLSLWNKESGWVDAANPISDARGIAQNINGYSSDYQQGNMPQQITWGINYIESRYGSPSSAWDHEVTDGWY